MKKICAGLKKVHVIGILLVTVCLLAAVIGLLIWKDRHSEPAITVSSVAEQLTSISELATSQLEYRGLVRYEDGQVSFLTKKAFTMIYNAKIKAGIDLSKAEIQVSNRKISVGLPAAQIQDVVIDPGSLEFYDEKFALFNQEHREDTVEAIKSATEAATQYAMESDLPTHAQDRAKLLVQSFLNTMVAERKNPPEIEVRSLQAA